VQKVNLNNIASDFMIAPSKKTENRNGALIMGELFHFNFGDKDGSLGLNENSNYLTGLPFINFWDNSLKPSKNASDQINSDDTIINGGDIAGIQAAPEIAYRNHKVYLTGRTGTNADLWATSDRTYPTFKCDACFLTPKTAENGQQQMIGLKTNSDFITTRIR